MDAHQRPKQVLKRKSSMDGRWRWRLGRASLEESPDSAAAVLGTRQKVGACRKAGRSDPTDAKQALAV